jgi:hypothetical protein
MNWGKLDLSGWNQPDGKFAILVNRETRKRRRAERLLAEQRTTRHQIQARNSCVADARNYRVARQFPFAGMLEWD